MVGYIIIGVIALLLIAMSIVLYFEKGSWMIAGYNTMSAEEKARWNAERLSRSTSKATLLAAVYIVFIGASIYLGNELLALISIPIFIVAVIIWVVYINKSSKLKN